MGVQLGSRGEAVALKVVAFRVRKIQSYCRKAGADEWSKWFVK